MKKVQKFQFQSYLIFGKLKFPWNLSKFAISNYFSLGGRNFKQSIL